MNELLKKLLKNKIIKIALFVLLALIICSAIFFIFQSIDKKRDLVGSSSYETSGNIDITIPKGATLSSISKILESSGIVKYRKDFVTFAIKNGNSSKYKYGVFSLNVDMSYAGLDTKLQENVPEPGMIRVTIPEGYEVRQIIKLLQEKGIGTSEKYTTSILNDTFDYWFLEGIDKSPVYLEGYLFPATYTFSKDSTEKEILNTMLEKFDSIYTASMKTQMAKLDMSINDIVTLASIVEREAGNDTERDVVASVFYNRLRSKTYPYLESCATIQYILKERKAVLSIADTEIVSPYNTYENPGLPPHPIASPGLKSINATLYPATTDYLFFVLGKDGKHIFSKTYAEHLDAKNRGV